jgi:ectoine hydroxylase-related dioxygenase (phytanoyl-CoA dioxygenase family)
VTGRTSLSEPQQADFRERGIVRLPGAFSADDAARMVTRLWKIFEDRYGARAGVPASWGGVIAATGLRTFRKEPVFRPIGSPVVRAAIDALLGAERWQEPKHWGQFLTSFPEAGRKWCVPHRLWHTDFPYLKWRSERPFGLLMFSFLSEVSEQSGGTVVVEGSHRVVRRFLEDKPEEIFERKMKQVRLQLMASDPWLKVLGTQPPEGDEEDRIRRFMEEHAEIGGIPVRVRELTGSPGDVILAHPWTLHSIASNCGESPRLMCVQRLRLN